MNPENISVLIVDDETIIVEQLVFFFNSLSYSVTGLSDPEEALELLHKQAFDIVLTDLKMPRISFLPAMPPPTRQLKPLNRGFIVIFSNPTICRSCGQLLKMRLPSFT